MVVRRTYLFFVEPFREPPAALAEGEAKARNSIIDRMESDESYLQLRVWTEPQTSVIAQRVAPNRSAPLHHDERQLRRKTIAFPDRNYVPIDYLQYWQNAW